jgi:transposase
VGIGSFPRLGPVTVLCPACGTSSRSRHSSYSRRLQDLPARGARLTVALRVTRLRCRHPGCDRRIFSERLPEVMLPLARRTRWVGEIVRLLGHSAGGRPAEHLLTRLGLTVSDDAVLRHLKTHAVSPPIASPLRVVGIDYRSWRKGHTYGTIMVDLEKHSVVDLLADRSSGSVATWLAAHPGVEIVSRDCHGLYAEGARNGAPQARQVAGRFHLVQNGDDRETAWPSGTALTRARSRGGGRG